LFGDPQIAALPRRLPTARRQPGIRHHLLGRAESADVSQLRQHHFAGHLTDTGHAPQRLTLALLTARALGRERWESAPKQLQLELQQPQLLEQLQDHEAIDRRERRAIQEGRVESGEQIAAIRIGIAEDPADLVAQLGPLLLEELPLADQRAVSRCRGVGR
jgi:hypothetical protein